ncbi:MAG: AMP-binding protein [Kiritimatiellae bacterium]|nr:AMP-binding protein [Kiritimatiellia bacterium]
MDICFLKDEGKSAMLAGDRMVSYAELLKAIGEAARTLNPASGSRVALYLENCPEWVFSFYAVWLRGAVNVTIDHELPPDEVAYILSDCRPELLVCSRRSEGRARAALEQSGVSCRLLVLEELAEASAVSESAPVSVSGDAERTAVIIYTSGTTGQPKGVMLSFNNLMENVRAVGSAGIFTREQRTLVLLPLHHVLPLVGSVLAPLATAGTLVFTPSLSPADMMATLQRHAVTLIIGVPRFYSLITGNIQARFAESVVARALYGLARWVGSPSFSRRLFRKVHEKFGGHMRFMVSGGAPLDPAVAECLRTLGFCVLEGYGMTEAAPMITFPRPDGVRPGSCGQALECNEVRIQDGEVISRGPNVMQGYYGRPEETAEVLRDGWLHTGDTGRLDADGHLFITGRIKEILALPSGKKVNPAEVEEKLMTSSPALSEVGVFLRDGVLQAVMRLGDQAPAGADETWVEEQILAPYNEKAASYKKIARAWIATQELPRTRLGKLRRFLLPDLAERPRMTMEQAEEPPSATCRRLTGCLARLVTLPVTADARLMADLGLDSLGRISLQVYVRESFGVDLNDLDFERLPTVRRLAEYIDGHKDRDVEKTIHWKDILISGDAVELPHSGWLHRLLVRLLNGLVRLCFRVRVEGVENIPDQGPFILVANHASYVDGLFLSAALTARRMQRVFFYAKERHVNNAFLRYLARHCNVIVMDINKRLRESIQKMSAALQSGGSIIIFPEGTRTRDGRLGAFRPTFAMLSLERKVPVLPAAIQGAFEALPPGRRLPRFFSPVTVRILPPAAPSGEDYQEMADRVREAISTSLN